jgi:hypothetical protein
MHPSVQEVVPAVVPDVKPDESKDETESKLTVEFDLSKKKGPRLVESMDVEKEYIEDGNHKIIFDMPVHGCATCNKCKFKIEYMEKLLTILLSRYNNTENYVDILMKDYSKRKFVMEYNEKNSNNPITEKDVKFKSNDE